MVTTIIRRQHRYWISLLVRILGIVMAVALGVGCAKPKLIPNTKIRETPLNREILEVCENYRRAMEGRDAASVLLLVHPTYQDNAGTPDGVDDRDFEGVKKLLATAFKQATKIRYRIEYQDLRTKGREAEVYAYIDATFIFEAPNMLPRWRRLTDHHRFRLLKDSDRWQFISGL